jgi:hypothetical protein
VSKVANAGPCAHRQSDANAVSDAQHIALTGLPDLRGRRILPATELDNGRPEHLLALVKQPHAEATPPYRRSAGRRHRGGRECSAIWKGCDGTLRVVNDNSWSRENSRAAAKWKRCVSDSARSTCSRRFDRLYELTSSVRRVGVDPACANHVTWFATQSNSIV